MTLEHREPAAGVSALDSFARKLRQADSYDELVEIARAEVALRFGLTNAWLYVCERDDDSKLVLVAAAGTRAAAIRELVPIIPRSGDALVEALLRDKGPVVIEDAQTGPFPEVTRRLGNRTVVNTPMSVVDHPLGILGCGTFGDEGVIALADEALSYLVQMANVASVALARMVLREHEAERAEMQARFAQRQRLESLGLLAGGVAHDFNNLLTVIRLSATLMERSALTPSQQADLEMIRDAETSASKLTQKLLTLGHKQSLSAESCDINAVVVDFVSLLRRVLPASIETKFIQGVGLPKLELDPSQLEQVLMNLALNARDAMPEGGRLTLETQQVLVSSDYQRVHPWAKQGRYVLLTATDTGSGMAPDVVERVFEPFFTTKKPGEGTGLGLAMCWGIVQQHGGMIHCYSEVGLGTTFKVYLPAAEQMATRVGSKVVGAAPGGNQSILVADDQPHVLQLLTRVLSDAGYRVIGVPDGEDAVSAARSGAFDLYVLDAVMPRMSGREARERILAFQPTARFLFASGYGREALPAEFLADTGVETIPKPLDPDALLRAVRTGLDSQT